jgi:outer membrane protein assembly factor BamB
LRGSRAALSAALLAPALFGVAVRAEDWPQFRGPAGQGHSAEVGLPTEWSESHNVVWKSPVPGFGWSSPVVADGRVWLTTAIEDGGVSLRALAFDVDTGDVVVNREIFRVDEMAARNPKNSHASPTPIIDGDSVFVHFGADGTGALSTNGDILWKTRLPYLSQHGNGGSSALYGDLLFVNCDGSDVAFIAALDRRTGEVRWKTPRRRPAAQAYSTPLVIQAAGKDQIISVGAFRVAAYDPESGDEIWWVSFGDGFSNVPRPVYGHGLVYIATGFQVPALFAIRPDGRGDVTRTHVAWTLRRGAPHTPSPLLVGEELYVISDLGVATCLDAKTGETYWQRRLGGNHAASPVFVDGRIYFQSEEGTTTVIAPGTTFRQLATSELDSATLASMAVSDGSIFIRSRSHLYRIGTRE